MKTVAAVQWEEVKDSPYLCYDTTCACNSILSYYLHVADNSTDYTRLIGYHGHDLIGQVLWNSHETTWQETSVETLSTSLVYGFRTTLRVVCTKFNVWEKALNALEDMRP